MSSKSLIVKGRVAVTTKDNAALGVTKNMHSVIASDGYVPTSAPKNKVYDVLFYASRQSCLSCLCSCLVLGSGWASILLARNELNKIGLRIHKYEGLHLSLPLQRQSISRANVLSSKIWRSRRKNPTILFNYLPWKIHVERGIHH